MRSACTGRSVYRPPGFLQPSGSGSGRGDWLGRSLGPTAVAQPRTTNCASSANHLAKRRRDSAGGGSTFLRCVSAEFAARAVDGARCCGDFCREQRGDPAFVPQTANRFQISGLWGFGHPSGKTLSVERETLPAMWFELQLAFHQFDRAGSATSARHVRRREREVRAR